METKIAKEFRLLDLLLVKELSRNEVLEILIVYNYLDRLFYILKLKVLFFESFNNSE